MPRPTMRAIPPAPSRAASGKTAPRRAAAASAALFDLLARASPVGIFRTDAKGRCLYVSERWCAIAGLTAEQARGDGWAAALHPDDRARVFAAWREAVAADRPFHAEYRFRRADGAVTWVQGEAIADRAADGALCGHIGTITDITARKHAEDALRASEARYRSLYSQTPAMMHSIDRAGRLLTVSDRWLEVLGYERAEVIGRPSVDFLTPESRRYAREVVLPEYFRTGVCKDVPYQFVAKSGAVVDVLLSAIAERDANGEVMRSLAVLTDVTERRRSEAEIWRLASIVQMSSDAIVSVTPDRRVASWNAGAEKLYGYSAAEMLGRPVQVTLPPHRAAEAAAMVARVLRGERLEFLETERLRKDGTIVPVALSVSPVTDPSGAVIGIASIARDLTERKRFEAALIDAKEQAEIANRAKSTFLANMSHELRTPLNAIVGFSEMMVHGVFGPLADERYRGYVADIHASGLHLLDIINDLLDLAKIEAGKMEIEEGVVAIGAVVGQAVRVIREQAGRAGIRLDVALAPALPRLRGDARAIKQILLNLMSNAVKFTPRGGRVTIAAAADGARGMRLQVADTGIGIAPEDIARLMQPFTQLETVEVRRHQGTGLGLALVQAMARLHGGSVTIESEPGSGTTVAVHLPASRLMAAYARIRTE
jgi:PAS domain S-box-containing protein